MMDEMNPEQLHWKLFGAISGIYLKSRRLAEESLKSLDLTWPQFGGLMTLNIQDYITQTELAERLESDTTTAMVICDSLQKKGFLKRVKDHKDRRVNRLQLTESGKEIFTKAYALMVLRYNILLKSVQVDDIEKILPILQRVHMIIKERYEMEINK